MASLTSTQIARGRRIRFAPKSDRGRGFEGPFRRGLIGGLFGLLVAGCLSCSDAQVVEGTGSLEATTGAGSGEDVSQTFQSSGADSREDSLRLISLNPSLTAIVLRLGGREALIAVDDYSAELFPEEAAGLPRIGGLFNPNLESIVELQPDEVLLVAGVDQQTHGARMTKAGVETEVFENEELEQVLENIRRLGKMLGRDAAAQARVEAIRRTRDAVAQVTARHAAPTTVAVLDRSPFYVVGAGTFLDEMLEAVGAENLGHELGPGYPRASIEWLVAAAPNLLLDMTPDEEDGARFWQRWPSLPAVARGRVLNLEASRISLPGPDIDRALVELAAAVHGPTIEDQIVAILEARGESPDTAQAHP